MNGDTISARGHTNPDGTLDLSVDVGIASADVAITLKVVRISPAPEVDERGWPKGYFEQVAGSMPDLERAPQGEYESRFPVE